MGDAAAFLEAKRVSATLKLIARPVVDVALLRELTAPQLSSAVLLSLLSTAPLPALREACHPHFV